jgi:hypothetical protein
MRTHRCVFLILLGLLAPAPEAGDWDRLVKEYIEAQESVKEPVPTAYPWLAKRLKTLFGVRGVGHIQVFSEKDGKRTLDGDIYYKSGEIHVIKHDTGWNLVTKGKEAYEWEAGTKEGLITKLIDKDLIDYLLYLTDPSVIMTCFYHAALFEPGKFLPPKEVEGGYIERRFKEPIEGFRAVFVSEEPAWLCGFEYDDGKDSKPVRTIFSKPKWLEQVPAGVFERLKGSSSRNPTCRFAGTWSICKQRPETGLELSPQAPARALCRSGFPSGY